MNARTLTTREKRMLAGCIAAILIAGTSLMLNEFLSRRAALDAKIAALEDDRDRPLLHRLGQRQQRLLVLWKD